MQLFAQILVNGILLGGLYGLMALGMGLVWGVLNIVNLAHGALIMLGGYAVYYLYTKGGIDPFAALPIAMVLLFLFGYLLQRFLLNLIVRSAQLNTLLITFGLDVVFVYLAQLLFSADFRTINPPYAGSNIDVGGVTIPYAQLAAFLVAIFLAAILFLFLDRTRTGRAIRATAQNLTAARLYGVVSQITPYIGVTLTAKSFVIAILGGLDKPIGVILGGLLLGIAEAMTALYLDPTFTDIISFGLLVLVLVAKPAQILGRA